MSDQADPKFVNTLQINGFLNGVVNLAYSTARWYPAPEPGNPEKVVVMVDNPITLDLRMDLNTAIETHAALERIIAQNTKPAVTN